jgi:Transglycosylase SLT domain
VRSRRRVLLAAALASGSLAVCAAAGAVIVTRSPHHHAAGTGTPAPGSGGTSAAAATGQAGTNIAPGSDPSAPAAPVAATVPRVAKLHGLTPPDIVVDLRHGASVRQLRRLGHAIGIEHVAALSRGNVRLAGRRIEVAGVPLSAIRGFTPKLTAVSGPLWRSVARGELTVAYTRSRPLRHRLGDTLPATDGHTVAMPLRIGAFATIALPHVQAMVSAQLGATLGLPPNREVLVAAPKPTLDALRGDVARVFGHSATVRVTRAVPVDQSIVSPYALTVIPTTYLGLYRRAAVTCPGLPWTVLAGIGTVETANGTNVHRSTKGAEGPMQFEPSTWARYGIDADGDGVANIQDPTDAVFSAARYLCAAGASRGTTGIDQAVFAYNHAWWYVREVLVLANRYA